MATVSAIYAFIEAIYGSQLAKDILGLFVKHGAITADQAAVLQSDHEDFLARIAAREAGQS